MVVQMLRCIKCLYEWLPRSDKLPRQCPKCKSYGWQEKKPLKIPPSAKGLTAESIGE